MCATFEEILSKSSWDITLTSVGLMGFDGVDGVGGKKKTEQQKWIKEAKKVWAGKRKSRKNTAQSVNKNLFIDVKYL